MTGRRGRVVRHNVTGCPQYELRAGSGSGSSSELESLNVNEVMIKYFLMMKCYFYDVQFCVYALIR